MTGYELSKDWFDWAFENPDLNSPTTTALYMWVIEKWNRMSQKPKFGFPASEAMEAIGVKSYNTYKKSLSQLVELGAIVMVQESKNQYTANIIAVLKFNKAHTKALSKHLLKQSEGTSESSSSIDKPRTSNLEPKNNTGGQAPIEPFVKPTELEIETYVLTQNPNGNLVGAKAFATAFWSHYENNGWKVGKNKMKNWKLAIVQWKDTLNKHLFPAGQAPVPAEQRKATPDLPNHMRGIEYSRSGIPNRTFKGNYNEYMDAVGCTPDEVFTIVREYVIQY